MLSETGLEGVPDEDWWTNRLLRAIEADPDARRIAYALVWRNANAEVRAAQGQSTTHWFGPHPGGADADDFRAFADTEFVGSGRDALYYARAIEAPSEAVGADPLGCRYDESGRCVEVDACSQRPEADDCLGETEERAWSSPIYVDQPRDEAQANRRLPAPGALAALLLLFLAARRRRAAARAILVGVATILVGGANPAAAQDADGDGVPDASDNCVHTANADQLDVGGLGGFISDGIGDACQCGDLNDDGSVDLLDAALYQRGLAGATPTALPQDKCSVIGGRVDCEPNDRRTPITLHLS